MKPNDIARSYAGGRVAIGILLLLFPRRVLRGMFGESTAVTFLGRLVGVRDLLLGLATLNAIAQGGASARTFMTYGAAADATDGLATLLAYRHLPRVKRLGLLAMAAGGAATGAYLTTTLDAG